MPQPLLTSITMPRSVPERLVSHPHSPSPPSDVKRTYSASTSSDCRAAHPGMTVAGARARSCGVLLLRRRDLVRPGLPEFKRLTEQILRRLHMVPNPAEKVARRSRTPCQGQGVELGDVRFDEPGPGFKQLAPRYASQTVFQASMSAGTRPWSTQLCS